MTTYPLSEAATIYRLTNASSDTQEVVARGTLSECAELLEGWSTAERASSEIAVDQMNLRYGSEDVEELLEFLRREGIDQSGPA